MRALVNSAAWTLMAALLMLTAGCRSGGEKEKYWKVDKGPGQSARTSRAAQGPYQPERVTTSSVNSRSAPLPPRQEQGESFSRNSGITRESLSRPGGAYRLKPGDPLIISLSGPIEKQVEDILDEEGNLNLTYIGTVQAIGKTSTQLEREIERLYLDKKIYKQLSVNIVVPTKYYFIRGNVRGPNRYPLIGRVTLMQAIAAAGGFNEFANPKKISLTRGNNTQVVDFNAIEKNPSRDVELVPGDSVYVPRRIF